MKRLLVVAIALVAVECAGSVKHYVKDGATREQIDKDYMDCYSATHSGPLS